MRGCFATLVGLFVSIIPPMILFGLADESDPSVILLLIIVIPLSLFASVFAGLAAGMFTYSYLSKHEL